MVERSEESLEIRWMRGEFEDEVDWVIGDGKEIRFWEDKWVDNEMLMFK